MIPPPTGPPIIPSNDPLKLYFRYRTLDRFGIKPGGIDKVAGEPPPPAESQSFERREVEEIIRITPIPTNTSDGANTPDRDLHATGIEREQIELDQIDPEGRHESARTKQPINSPLAEYVTYNGLAGPDPRTVNVSPVADGLCRIIEVEGPMLAKRAYDIYLRGCGIKRLGGELKSTMKKALMSAIRQGRVISENEPGETGLIFSTVRIKVSPPIRPRRRGPRTFEEIPPGELRYIGQHVLESGHVESGSDEHLRAILDIYGLKRLTTQVGTMLLEILDREDKRADLFRMQ
jgi:hypothetical protein